MVDAILVALLLAPFQSTPAAETPKQPVTFTIRDTGELGAGPKPSDGPAVLPFEGDTVRIRNGAPGPRTLLLPLRTTDLAPLLQPIAGAAGMPTGAHFVACEFGSGLCATWTMQPSQTIDIPLRVLRANTTDGVLPTQFVVRDGDGKTIRTPLWFAAQKPITLNASGFLEPGTPAAPRTPEAAPGLNGRAMTAAIVRNTHDAPYALYLEVGGAPAGPLAQLAGLAGFTFIDCPMKAGVLCATATVPPDGTIRIPLALLDALFPGHRLDMMVRGAGGAVPVNALTTLQLQTPSSGTPQPAGRTGLATELRPGVRGLLVQLDNTGIADWDFLNPRNPPVLEGAGTEIAFANRTVDRTFVVAVPVNRETAGDLKVEACRHAADLQCTILTISPGTTQYIRREAVTIPQRPLVRFTVSFFDDAVAPTRSLGFFRTSTASYESPSGFPWGLTAQIAGAQNPEFLKDANNQDERITEDTPYDGRMTSALSGLARMTVKPNLGDRANAEVDLLLHQRNLGGTDARLVSGQRSDLDPVSIPRYVVSVYAMNGVQFTFGKQQFLDTNLLAEAGEGFRFSYRNFGVVRLLKRESAERIPNRENDDHDVWIAQANHLPIPRSRSLRSVSLSGVYGRDDRPESKRTYWSAGIEAFFSVPALSVQGVASVVHNRRDPEAESDSNRRGEGTVGLFTATWSKLSPAPAPKVQRSVSLTYAQASSDRLNTTTVDEGFVGESGKFAPDILFLGSFVSRLGPAPNPLPLIPPGLSNKSYVAVAYNEETFSLLEWVATLIGVPPEDVISRRTTVRYHRYRFREAILGTRHPGDEVGIDFTIETPRGIRTQLGYSRFLSAPSFTGLFRKEPWRLAASISLSM